MEMELFLYPRRTRLVFTCVLGSYAASTVLLVPTSFGGRQQLGRQLREDEECPFNGVTSSGRICRKVPESDARSAHRSVSYLARVARTASVDIGKDRSVLSRPRNKIKKAAGSEPVCGPVWPSGRLVGRGTSVRICVGSPFSSQVVVCGHCLVCDFVPHNL